MRNPCFCEWGFLYWHVEVGETVGSVLFVTYIPIEYWDKWDVM